MGQLLSFPNASSILETVSSSTPSTDGGSTAKTPAQAETAASPSDSVTLGSSQSGGDSLEAVTYSSKMERVSLAVTLQQLRAQLSEMQDGSTKAATVESNQLTFEFFAETRTEELAAFRQRTGAVADGLSGTQQETYMAASSKVAARFQMSITISGEALSGFSRASEDLANGSSDMFDKFLKFAGNLLTSPDDIMNETLKFLDGFFRGNKDPQDAFAKFLKGVFGIDPSSNSAQSSGKASANSSSSLQIEFQMEFSFESSTTVQVATTQVQQSDPITFDLDGDGIELSNYRDGAKFDIAGKGQNTTTAFITGGDAFLAIDRNGNGIVDNGKELFGDQNGAANGYKELAKLDSNRDGFINKQDKDFDKLLLFKDNGNGKTESGELISLTDGGIAELNLNYQDVDMRTSGGNNIGQISSYRRNDGSTGRLADTILFFTA